MSKSPTIKFDGPRFDGVPRSFAREPRLSPDAKSVLLLAMTFDESWVFRRVHMLKWLNMSKNRFARANAELAQFGCYVLERYNEDGKIKRSMRYSWGRFAYEHERFTEDAEVIDYEE